MDSVFEKETEFEERGSREKHAAIRKRNHQELLSLQCHNLSMLSDCELLAMVLRTGGQRIGSPFVQARKFLEGFGTLSAIEKAGVTEIAENIGICKERVLSIQAALHLGKRLFRQDLYRGKQFLSARQCFSMFRATLGVSEQKMLWILFLNEKNCVIKLEKMVSWEAESGSVSLPMIFTYALRERASKILLLFNHPSGNPEPLQQEQECLEKVSQVGSLLGISVLDVLVLTSHNFVSFADRGWLSCSKPFSSRD